MGLLCTMSSITHKENLERAARIFKSWPKWKQDVTLTQDSAIQKARTENKRNRNDSSYNTSVEDHSCLHDSLFLCDDNGSRDKTSAP